MKRCSKCAQSKPLEQFYRCSSAKDGHHYSCKSCMDAYEETYKARRHELRRARRRENNSEWFVAQEARQNLEQQGLRKCGACGEIKALELFRIGGTHRKTPYRQCAVCLRAKEVKTDHRDRREYSKARYWANRAVALAKCADWRFQLRQETLARYGGQCECCGEKTIEFLSIDHINGGGNQHRRTLAGRGGVGFYSWLRKHGWPEGYRVMCFNCNLAIGFYGHCPHQERVLKVV